MPILGKTLMNIGSQLPDIYRTNRRLGEERLDRQRRMEREDTTWEQQQEEYARKKALEREAQTAIEGYESGVKAQTPLPEGQEGPVAPQRSRYELGMESGLPRYQNVSPEVKGLWGAISDEEKRQKGMTGGVLSTYFNQRLNEAKKYYKTKYPEKSDEEVSNLAFEAVQAPSFSVQTTPEGLEKTRQLSESRKMGSLSPTVISAETNKAASTAGAGTKARIESEFETRTEIPGSFKSSQYEAGNYAHRIDQSESVLSSLTNEGFDPGAWYNKIKSADAANAIKDPKQRKYAQAMRNFINATLRRESGAAIAESEFTNAHKQYFAQLNDDPETLAQKAENRARVLDAFKAEAGGAYDQIKGKQKARSKPTDFDSFWNEVNK